LSKENSGGLLINNPFEYGLATGLVLLQRFNVGL